MPRFPLSLALVVGAGLALAGCRASCTRVCCPTPVAAPPLEIHPTPRARIDEPDGGAKTVANVEADRTILEALRAKRMKDLQWAEETTLADAVTYLRTITGLDFFLTPKAQSERQDVRVPLSVDNVSVATILDLITSQNAMAWEIRDGVVRLATAEEVSDTYALRFYDVHDIVADGRPPESPTLETPDAATDSEAAPPPFRKADLLIVTIRTLMEMPGRNPNASVDLRGGVMIVRTSAATHARIERYLIEVRDAIPRKLPPISSR